MNFSRWFENSTNITDNSKNGSENNNSNNSGHQPPSIFDNASDISSFNQSLPSLASTQRAPHGLTATETEQIDVVLSSLSIADLKTIKKIASNLVRNKMIQNGNVKNINCASARITANVTGVLLVMGYEADNGRLSFGGFNYTKPAYVSAQASILLTRQNNTAQSEFFGGSIPSAMSTASSRISRYEMNDEKDNKTVIQRSFNDNDNTIGSDSNYSSSFNLSHYNCDQMSSVSQSRQHETHNHGPNSMCYSGYSENGLFESYKIKLRGCIRRGERVLVCLDGKVLECVCHTHNNSNNSNNIDAECSYEISFVDDNVMLLNVFYKNEKQTRSLTALLTHDLIRKFKN